METFLNVLFLIIGLALLIKGADFFVSGASSIAKKLKVPAIFIGLTVVALGTSLPELSVSIVSAIQQSIDMSVGNIVGSNMMNMLLILGVVALIKPITVDKSSKKVDFPFLLVVTFLLLLFSADTLLDGGETNTVSRTESLILIAVLVYYLVVIIKNARKQQTLESLKHFNMTNSTIREPLPKEKILKGWQIALCIVFGLAAVVFGAECVSSTAQFLALKMGMSEVLVGLTIVAIGTSLPEFATSIAAAKKDENQLALGNVIGSNIFNIALILGVVGSITQIPVSNLILVDVLILFISTIIFSLLCMLGKKVTRIKGAVLVCIYIAYIAFAIVRNYCF